MMLGLRKRVDEAAAVDLVEGIFDKFILDHLDANACWFKRFPFRPFPSCHTLRVKATVLTFE